MTTITTFDLGHGWFANLMKDGGDVETMTLLNPDKGQRIDLGADSLKTLRSIFKQVDEQAAVHQAMASGYAVWYMKPEFFRDGIMGYDFLKKIDRVPDPKNLSATHVHLMDVEAGSNPSEQERIYTKMQGENWSPNGEAQKLIEARGLKHTSMSMGDILVWKDTGDAWIVDRFGFRAL